MNPRERVLRALAREEPDRVPISIASSHKFMVRLLNHLGNPSREELIKRLGVDIRGIGAGPPNEFREKAVVNPLYHYAVGIPLGDEIMEDEWGVRRTLNVTKTASRIIYHPLQNVDSLEDYIFPDPEAPGRFPMNIEETVQTLKKNYVVSGGFGGDTYFSQAWYLRGFTELIRDMYANPCFVNQLMDGLMDYYVPIARRLAELDVDILAMADDIASQTGMIISPPLWRRYIKSRMKTIIDAARKVKKDLFIYYHSDGALNPIIPDLIEIGVDILNPVQPECMDPAKIKMKYGDQLVIWGAISIQKTLPYGTVADIQGEVITRMETCGNGGGLVLGPSNDILEDTPVENFLALYEALKRYGRYPCKIPSTCI